MSKHIYIFIGFWFFNQGFAQLNLAQFEQIDSLQKNEKRKVIVFIHTDWCKYCKAMQNKTFKNEKLVKAINDKFYFVDFNAEEKRKITFNNVTFHFKPNGANTGVHELAMQLGTIDSQMSYPTLCILNEKSEIIFQYGSFLNAKDLINILDKL